MEQKLISALVADTRRFFAFAKDLAEFAARRLETAARLSGGADALRELCAMVMQKNELALQAHMTLREQYTTIGNACSTLITNAENQKAVLAEMKGLNEIDPRVEKRMMYKVLKLLESLQKGMGLARGIVDRTDGIILLASRIGQQGTLVMDRAAALADGIRRLSARAEEDGRMLSGSGPERSRDAEHALYGSGDPGMFDPEGRARLLEDIGRELDLEACVARSGIAPHQGGGDLHRMAGDLCNDAGVIRELMESKDAAWRENLENTAELSVVLSIEIDEYLKIRETFDPAASAPAGSPDLRRRLADLAVLWEIAGNAVENLSELNQYTVEISDINAKREEQLLASADEFRERCEVMRGELEECIRFVDTCEEKTRNNIIIGQVLEKNLRKLMQRG